MNINESDIVLWETFRKGDKESFAKLFRKYYSDLFLYGMKFTPDRAMLEDCIHELFIECWQSSSQTPVISVKAYLFKSLKYKLMKLMAAGQRLESWTEGQEPGFEWSHDNFLVTAQESREKKELVIAAVKKLSSRQKEMIYLKFYLNLSYEEVSAIMNINYQTARNLLYQSIKALKKILLHSLHLLFTLF